MAEYGGYMDPFASTQEDVGETRAIGNTAINPNDPLIDWASNLSKDDLARFLHDPQGMAAEFAQRGVPPPPMDKVHAINEGMGTPTVPKPAESVDHPLTPRQQATRGVQEWKAANEARSVVGGKPATTAPAFAEEIPPQPYPKPSQWAPPGTQPSETAGNIAGKVGSAIKEVFTHPANPSYGQSPVSPTPAPPAAPPAKLEGGRGEGYKPFPTERPETAGPRAEPDTGPPGSSFLAAERGPNAPQKEEPEVEKTYNPSTPEGRKNILDKLGDLGKAMQGVKAPEPLKPPGFAPSPGRPSPVGAPNITQLLGALSGGATGQVPPSIMPILRLTGR